MRTPVKFFGAAAGAAVLFAAALAVPNSAAAFDTNAPTAAPAAPWQAAGLTEVLKMFRGGISQDILVNYINNSPLSFYLSADNIISLQQQGVPAPVVQAMIQRNGEAQRQVQTASTQAAVAVPAQAPAPKYYAYSDNSFDAALQARQAASYYNYTFAPTSYAPPVYNYYDPYYSPWGFDTFYPGVVVGFGGIGRGFHGSFGHVGGGFHGGFGGHVGGFGGSHAGGFGGGHPGGGHR